MTSRPRFESSNTNKPPAKENYSPHPIPSLFTYDMPLTKTNNSKISILGSIGSCIYAYEFQNNIIMKCKEGKKEMKIPEERMRERESVILFCSLHLAMKRYSHFLLQTRACLAFSLPKSLASNFPLHSLICSQIASTYIMEKSNSVHCMGET